MPVATNNQQSQEGTIMNQNEISKPNQEDLPGESSLSPQSMLHKKAAIGLALIVLIVLVIIDSTTTQYLPTALESFLGWVGDNPTAGFFGVIIVYFIAAVLFIPGSILTLGSGFIFANALGLGWGVVVGSAAVFIGASAGACASFLLAKYILREWTQKLTGKYPVFEALDVALEENGFRIMCLLRLSPLIPFNALNYIAGVTAITFFNYVIACIGMLPATMLYVFLGASAGSITDSFTSGSDPTLTIIIVVISFIFGVGAVALTSYYAKQKLNTILEERQSDSASNDELNEKSENNV